MYSKTGICRGILTQKKKRPLQTKAVFYSSILLQEKWLFNPYKASVQFWDIGKQCRSRSDAAERGVWSGSSLFSYNNIYSK